MRDYITCHGCGINVYPDLAIRRNENWFCSTHCSNRYYAVGFHPLDELQRTQMNDRRVAQKEIDREFEDFRREHI